MFVKALDIANSLVAYIPEEDSISIRVENFYSGDHMNILEKNICSAAFKGDCIDTSFFDNGNYIYTLNGSKWGIYPPEIIRKEVHVKLY